jgi:hypothetical protein
MTMGWMETIRFLGLDLMVATVFAVAGLDATARAFESAWARFSARLPSAPGLKQSVPRLAFQRSATTPGRP